MEWLMFLYISGLMVIANSQNVIPNQNNFYNQDVIYFDDNKPSTGRPNRQVYTQNGDLQSAYNNVDVIQVPVTKVNEIDTSTNINWIIQRPVNNFNAIQQARPVGDFNAVQQARPVGDFNAVQQAVYENPTNKWNVKVPVNDFNAIQQPIYGITTNKPTIGNFNGSQQPVYDQTVSTNSRNSEKFQRNQTLQTISLGQISIAMTNFSINVMKRSTSQKQGNVVVSPYSIASVLSLLQQGSLDLALEQISVALQMSKQTSATVYKSQVQDILDRRSQNVLRTANKIYVADAFRLNPQFKAVAQRDFDCDINPISFQWPDDTARQINNWVSQRTDSKIDKLVSPESLSENTQMVLVNAIYFKGLWAVPFRLTSSRVDIFTLSNGVKKNLTFMMARRYLKAGVDKQTDSKIAILPFEGDEYSMMIIVPAAQSNAQATLATLTVSQLESYLNFKSIEVLLKLPKFTIKADTDLSPVLKQMGVTKIFEQNSGLEGLGMYGTLIPQVSSAVHSAVLTIDEQGSTAAAASAFAAVALSNDDSPLSVRAERPFIAVLWDEKTKVPLFMAKIEDPTIF